MNTNIQTLLTVGYDGEIKGRDDAVRTKPLYCHSRFHLNALFSASHPKMVNPEILPLVRSSSHKYTANISPRQGHRR